MRASDSELACVPPALGRRVTLPSVRTGLFSAANKRRRRGKQSVGQGTAAALALLSACARHQCVSVGLAPSSFSLSTPVFIPGYKLIYL